jgi:hypothetical protein
VRFLPPFHFFSRCAPRVTANILLCRCRLLRRFRSRSQRCKCNPSQCASVLPYFLSEAWMFAAVAVLLLSPGKCGRIVSLFCMSRVIAAHAVIKSPVNAFHHTPKTPSCSHRISLIALTSHVTRLVLFTHHTSRPQLLSQFLIVSHSHRIFTPVSTNVKSL